MIWLIGLGGSLGAASRFLLGNYINRGGNVFYPFPISTWLINISGSLLLGLILKFHLSNQIPEWAWNLFGIGFCGAYTTFSTFGFETLSLVQANKTLLAAVYVITSITVGTLAAFAGLIIL
ncbi:fluoride efflux transporter CrcB [Bacillus sp. MRMR6]|uniref:fluoride efflux transporter CrcB n=1 Tax=Bacillus sp. MRMR6 TaxID=1928617 RepID=UPI00095130F8|nr:fluoride efflux transporter CrcB [Bacillus sp. MRMR6]OLS36823.1 chromosome condensation protein CrcB [Bacillus sp. MRMR6]